MVKMRKHYSMPPQEIFDLIEKYGAANEKIILF
jgi:hypothetical protein